MSRSAIEGEGGADLGGLVPLAGDDEWRLAGPVELPDPLVEGAGEGNERDTSRAALRDPHPRRRLTAARRWR